MSSANAVAPRRSSSNVSGPSQAPTSSARLPRKSLGILSASAAASARKSETPGVLRPGRNSNAWYQVIAWTRSRASRSDSGTCVGGGDTRTGCISVPHEKWLALMHGPIVPRGFLLPFRLSRLSRLPPGRVGRSMVPAPYPVRRRRDPHEPTARIGAASRSNRPSKARAWSNSPSSMARPSWRSSRPRVVVICRSSNRCRKDAARS
jgi:hypothetical protein